MARKCACEALLTSEFAQVRLRLVPAAARWVWLMLAKAMMVSDEPGVLRFGSGIGLSALVSALVSVSETEAETELENLLRVGLLIRTAEDEIALPAMTASRTRRAETARANGLKGGRPRKDTTDRRQGALPMVIDGGAPGKTQENPTGDPSVSHTTTVSSGSSGGQDSDQDWVSIAREACEAAGFDEASGLHTYGVVKDWVGVGATRDIILDLIRRRAGPHVKSLRYFDQAVREAARIAKATPAPAARVAEWERIARQRWNDDMERWQDYGRQGPMPDLAATIAAARPKEVA